MVTLNVAKSDVYHNAALLWEKEFQKKKGTNPFNLLLPEWRNAVEEAAKLRAILAGLETKRTLKL